MEKLTLEEIKVLKSIKKTMIKLDATSLKEVLDFSKKIKKNNNIPKNIK